MTGSASRRRSIWRPLWAGSALLLWAFGCASPPPDPDGEPGLAMALALGATRRDQLDCRGGDCADWYRIRLPARGELFIDVAALEAGDAATPYTLTLNNGRNQPLGQGDDAGAGRRRMHREASEGYYLLAISSPEKSRLLRYELLTRFEPEPPPPAPPPEPRFQPLSSEVLEVEGRPGDPRSVLIDRGQADGIQPGLRGRLLQDGEEIATVEIVDAYPDGSRARIEGTLSAPITPSTQAEIDIPLGDGAGGHVRPAPGEPHGSAARPD